MYTYFEVKNFRCFEHLVMEDLARVNLIAGKNNVGKTAFLEALFVRSARNPFLTVYISDLRNLKIDTESVDQSRSVWENLFHNFDVSEDIELIGKNDKKSTVKLQIVSDPSELKNISLNVDNLGEGDQFSTPFEALDALRLVYKDDEIEQSYNLLLSEDGLRFAPNPSRPAFLTVLLGSKGGMDTQTQARLFGNIVKQNKRDLLVNALRIVEPRIQHLELLPWTNETILHGYLDSGKPLPINLMGEGTSKLAHIILSIFNVQNGILLVDEIENGFHYSILFDVWRAIAKAARDFDVQIFATTHSFECIRAAHRAFSEGDAYDFRLHRLERVEGKIEAVTYKKNILEAALDVGFEVR